MNLIKVCLIETYTKDDLSTGVFEMTKHKLDKLFANTFIDDPAELSLFNDNDEISDDNIFLLWFNEQVSKEKENVAKCEPGNVDNYLYFPKFIALLKRLLNKLPLWSKVMCPIFKNENKAPSSSAVEDYFKTLKK